MLVDVFVLAQHVQRLQLLGDVVALAQQLSDLLRIFHRPVLLERRAQGVAEVVVALGVVLAQVQQLPEVKTAVNVWDITQRESILSDLWRCSAD